MPRPIPGRVSTDFEAPSHSNSAHTAAHHNDDACGTLTLAELKTAFITLSRQNLKGFKICLFIDGLDEYVGDQLEVANLFKAVVCRSPVIKTVVSSRPEPVFIEVFRDCPNLRMEHLTEGDIKLYVHSQLLSHSRMQSQGHESSQLAESLVNNISKKACGVFLWVFLVVRLLLERLSDGTYPEELEAIIDNYPEELHDLYQHMFARMKPLHRAEAFRLFQAIHHAQAVESRIPSALRLSFLARERSEAAIDMPLRTLTAEELEVRLSLFEDRLRSRCCGFFEVKYFDSRHSESVDAHIPEGSVDYLHRTVSDFLKDEAIRGVIEKETRDFNHEIYGALMASILYSFKRWRFCRLANRKDWGKFTSDIAWFLTYCQLSQASSGSAQIQFIDEFDKSLQHLWKIRGLETRAKALGLAFGNFDCHWAESVLLSLSLKPKSEPDENPLISLTARYGLSTYVCQKLQVQGTAESISQKNGNTWGRSTMLSVCTWAIQRSSLRQQYFEIIEALLTLGLPVNAYGRSPSSVQPTTLWQEILSIPSTLHLISIRREPAMASLEPGSTRVEVSEVAMLDVWTQVVETFVRFGASVDRIFNTKSSHRGGKSGTARERISDTVAALHARGGLTSEELRIRAGTMTRIEKLLANKAPTMDATGSSIPANIPENADRRPPTAFPPAEGTEAISRPTTNERRKRRSAAGEKALEKALEKAEVSEMNEKALTPELFVVSGSPQVSGPCSRCSTLETLTKEYGFPPTLALRAIVEAGVGNDIPALIAWILDHDVKDRAIETGESSNSGFLRVPSPSATVSGKPSSASNGPRAPSPTHATKGPVPRSRNSEKQWAVVPTHSKKMKGPSPSTVIGADYVRTSTAKKKHRRSATKTSASSAAVTATEDDDEAWFTASEDLSPEGSSYSGPSGAGAIELKQGTFTWFFEGRRDPGTLTGDQQRRLEEFLTSMIC